MLGKTAVFDIFSSKRRVGQVQLDFFIILVYDGNELTYFSLFSFFSDKSLGLLHRQEGTGLVKCVSFRILDSLPKLPIKTGFVCNLTMVLEP